MDLSLLSAGDQSKVKDLLWKFQSVFSTFEGDLECTDLISHDIPLLNDASVQQWYRCVPPSDYEAVQAHINQLLETQVIRESCSPCFSNRACEEKRWESTHMCRLPPIEHQNEEGCFSFTLDLTSGYNQVPVKEGDKYKTAFCTPFGLFKWNRMLFGLCNAPSTFQRLMQHLFRDQQCQSLLLYLDDIVVFSSSVEQHLERLEVVLGRLERQGLKPSWRSVCFFSLR